MTPQPYSSISTSENGVMSLWPWMLPAIAPVCVRPTMRSIAEAVAAKYGLAIDDLKGDSRDALVVLARQEAMWMMRQRTPRTPGQIGRFFGRHRASISQSVKAHERRLSFHPEARLAA